LSSSSKDSLVKMGIAYSIQNTTSLSTDNIAETGQVPVSIVITEQPINSGKHTVDQLRYYNRAYQLGIEKSHRMVSYYLTQARLHGKPEFIKTLYASCIAACIPPVHHSTKLDTQWMYRILTGIQREFPDCNMDVISSCPEYLTIRFRI